MDSLLIFTIFIISIQFSDGTLVDLCRFGTNNQINKDYTAQELSKNVDVNNCEKPPCKLHKLSSPQINIRFKPKHDITNLSNTIYGQLGPLPLPYPGVFGTSSCDSIWFQNGTKTACPLQAGLEYEYVKQFEVLAAYPEVPVRVHWALTDTDQNKDVVCFEVNTRIMPAQNN